MQNLKPSMLLATGLVSLVATTSTAASESKTNPFQGFYGQISTGYESNSFSNTSTRYTNITPPEYASNGINTSSNQTASGVPLVLGLGYNFALTEKWLLGIGADYSFLSQSTSGFSAKNPAFAQSTPALGQKIQASNRVNVFLTAGYALTQRDLIYAKAGYSNQQLQFTRPAQDSATSYSSKSNQGGYVLGLGYQRTIEGGLYVYAEANYMKYSSTSLSGSVVTRSGDDTVTTRLNQSPSASAVTALIGLGYRF
jgi:outer membrane immunogenic protein